MAPEQCNDAATVDARADLYAIGCIAYEMLTGIPPFGFGGVEIIAAHMRDEPMAVRQRNASVPPQLEMIIALWVMDTSGGNRVQITNEFCLGCNGNEMPVWHPSGQRLVFVSDTKTQNRDIWMVELDGARMVQLTNYLGNDMTPEFTHDGRYLMFASTRGGDVHHIWMGEFAAN